MGKFIGKPLADYADMGEVAAANDLVVVYNVSTDAEEAATISQITSAVSEGISVTHRIDCVDETTSLTVATVATFRMPHAFTLTGVRASLTSVASGADLIVDIQEGGVTVLSTLLSIDANTLTSTTATTPAVISDAALADDAEITIDVTQIGSGNAGAGLKVTLIGLVA